jgi:hydroxylaminobenzene mutase
MATILANFCPENNLYLQTMPDDSNLVARQGHRMLQIGIWLFVFSGVEGFVIPSLPAPRLGLSVHTLSALQGVMLIGLGLLWSRLRLTARLSRIAFWTYLYSSFATLIPYIMAAAWGAGNSTIPMAAGDARGSLFQETIIKTVIYSAAFPFFVSMALVLWGLRIPRDQAGKN